MFSPRDVVQEQYEKNYDAQEGEHSGPLQHGLLGLCLLLQVFKHGTSVANCFSHCKLESWKWNTKWSSCGNTREAEKKKSKRKVGYIAFWKSAFQRMLFCSRSHLKNVVLENKWSLGSRLLIAFVRFISFLSVTCLEIHGNGHVFAQPPTRAQPADPAISTLLLLLSSIHPSLWISTLSHPDSPPYFIKHVV